VRPRIVRLLRDRARSTTELAQALGLAKGTVAHHLKTLERAGLVRVVRTRKVRAITERFYGRTARLFVVRGEAAPGRTSTGAFAAASLRRASEEIATVPFDVDRSTVALLHVRLRDEDLQRFVRRLRRLAEEFSASEDPAGSPTTLVAAIFPRTDEDG
jgi:DNA-binding transcriptional ArsR family regulator